MSKMLPYTMDDQLGGKIYNLFFLEKEKKPWVFSMSNHFSCIIIITSITIIITVIVTIAHTHVPQCIYTHTHTHIHAHTHMFAEGSLFRFLPNHFTSVREKVLYINTIKDDIPYKVGFVSFIKHLLSTVVSAWIIYTMV